MKIKYVKETDVVYIGFSSLKIDESDQKKPGIILDYVDDGQIVWIEILKASPKMGHENGILYEVAWSTMDAWQLYAGKQQASIS